MLPYHRTSGHRSNTHMQHGHLLQPHIHFTLPGFDPSKELRLLAPCCVSIPSRAGHLPARALEEGGKQVEQQGAVVGQLRAPGTPGPRATRIPAGASVHMSKLTACLRFAILVAN